MLNRDGGIDLLNTAIRMWHVNGRGGGKGPGVHCNDSHT